MVLLNDVEIVHFQPNDILVEQGSEEEQLFLVLSGSILHTQVCETERLLISEDFVITFSTFSRWLVRVSE